MSILHYANGQVLVTELRAFKGTLGMGVSLTLITPFNITFSVSLHGGPIITLRVRTVCQSSSAWVIATYAFIKFSQYIFGFCLAQTL